MKQHIDNIDFSSTSEGMFDRLLVSALADSGCSEANQKKLLEIWNKRGWDITFRIEGIDIDLRKIMGGWENQLDRMVADKAKELVKKKTGDLMESLETLMENVTLGVTLKIEEALGVVALEPED